MIPDLFRRNCVTCPSTPPECSTCTGGKYCSLSIQTCQQCPEAKCVSPRGTSLSNKSAGAIAGGVVGGLVGIGIIVGIIFWYKFRGRRNRHLQDMKEAALEYDSPPDSPELNPYEEDGYARKSQSFRSDGGNSNAIPIMFPYLQSGANSMMSQRVQMGKIRHTDGAPSIRDSIHDSEYSVESEYIPGANNQALRAYDVAVQGLPSVVHVAKSARTGSDRRVLGRIAEDQVDSSPSEAHSVRETASERASNRSSGTSHRFRMMNRNSQLPPAPDTPSSSKSKTLNPPSRPASELDNASTVSPFSDDKEHIPQRYSRASTTEYVADLPEEAKLYQGHGYF